ncbi:histidine kinase dimerization/phosphoacceptor domain -containing protein [Falsirhodobacter sp. 20TX0035]|uniref:histidine kinase dimerization/phosphoacceptor domain -containing protein n=1 Tax=Falsirhodobacter sp. 20TX0035 TaxID=3022019 RepID=UPI00232D0278|nr:histidine kinase dimerization/phosphoacceptor domain -containing protein [Falsirhodobacter sp. 20TX0035]MDB6452874.1 histidine kinase dimerization/phosphoacceptor domain -containing protein [Falsirhodobacter sp. 20TX0035]
MQGPTDLLTACDREPIHIPGSIQPHGQMLVARAEGLRVTARAGLPHPRFEQALNAPLADVLGPDLAASLDDLDGTLRVVGVLDLGGEAWDTVAFRSGDHVVVECTPQRPEHPLDASFLNRLEQVGTGFERAVSFPDLFQKAAHAFRTLTGYDRVMVYRFIQDEAGVVVGESLAPDAPSFMNHHFPASDIPRQARALYVRNRVRVIADVGYDPQPIRGEGDMAQLDLSDSTLRSVSPVHIQYLKNMGIQASASVSIVKDGLLWGLIACHHHEPRSLSLTTRLACQTLAVILSRQIRAREDADLYRERIRLRAQEDVVLSNLGSERSLADFFADSGHKVAALLNADGFAAVQGLDLFTVGHCPDPSDIRALAEHVRLPAALRTYATHQLSRDFPDAAFYSSVASGVVAVTMSTEVPTILMWFRAEHLQTVTWAGNPHKDIPADPNATLNPRTSFEQWSETVTGRARPWTHAEEEAAARIVRLMLEARNNQRVRELNREIATTLKENESLLRQKDFLLREVNHRVQNSLSLVAAFLRMQAREASPEVKSQLGEAENRLKAVSLVHRRLHQNDSVEILDLARYLDDLCVELKDTIGENWARQLDTNFTPILISTDRAISIGLIVNELITNATKYAYGDQTGPISIMLEQHRDQFRLIVADSGVGRHGPVQGSGFGSRMLASLVERLGGHLDLEDNLPGTRAVVTAPIR